MDANGRVVTSRARWAATALLVACLSCSRSADVPPPARVDLTGAGATFPYPLYRAWFSEYGQRNNVRINYFSVGSAEGLRLLAQGDVDFGATDKPFVAPSGRAPDCTPIAVPMVAGSIALGYNLPGTRAAAPLRFDVRVLADIFAGRITRWDAPALRALNGSVSLPSAPIVVVHRATGSGTGRAFSDFLATSGRWVGAPHDTVDVRWPVGVAAEGNEGVAAEVKATQYAIGFMELAYARQNHLSIGAVLTTAGHYVVPGGDATDYPITARTWIILDPRIRAARGDALVAFVRWALERGAAQARAMEYSPASPDSVARYEAVLRGLRFGSCH